LGRTSEMVKAQKLKFFIFREFIDIDTDGHGFDWVVGCAGSSVQVFTMVWVELGWIGHLVGRVGVEAIGPTDNSEIEYVCFS